MALQDRGCVLRAILLPEQLDQSVLLNGMASGGQEDLEDLSRPSTAEVLGAPSLMCARDLERSEGSNP
jgi:hypothetical protein